MAQELTVTPRCGYYVDQANTIQYSQWLADLCALENAIAEAGGAISPDLRSFINWIWQQVNSFGEWLFGVLKAGADDIALLIRQISDAIASAAQQISSALGTDLWIIFGVAALLFFSPEIAHATKDLLS